MAMEIILNRHDETPWGFRMTGGKEFQSPFFVVKVGRGSIAEKSGLYIGDMVYAINHEYADQYTHADAQRVIVHTGKTLILNIRRGELRPGYSTPMPDFTDAIMAIEAPPPPTPPPIPSPPPPYEPPPKKLGLGDMDFLQNLEEVEGFIKTEPPKVETPPPEPLSPETPEGDLEQDAFFSIKIKRSGRISTIEELEGPSRSPSTGRSRSPSRERKKSLTKSSRSGSVHKCQETEGYSSMSERNETLTTESSEMITSSLKSSVSQEQKTSSQAKKTISDLTDDDITDMLTGEAQVLIEEKGTIGINFNKLIPKVNFIKDSSVLKALEEQQFRKEESEEVQLAREPTKRFSTFLQKPARPIPQPKFESQVINDDLPWKKRLISETVQQIVEKEAVTNESSSRRASVQNDSRKQSVQNEADELSLQLEEIIEKEVTVEEESTMVQHTSIEQTEVVEEEVEGLGIVIGQVEITDDMVEVQVDDGDDEKKSVHFEDEVQKQSRSESISTVQSLKLEGYSRKDIKTFKKEEVYEESKKVVSGRRQSKDDFEEQLAQIQEKLSAIQKLPEEIQSHVTSVQEQLTKIVEMKCAADEASEEISEYEQDEDVKEIVDDEEIPEEAPTLNEADTNVEDENVEEQMELEDRQQQTESGRTQEEIPQEPEGPEYLEAPPSSRFPHTPQPRPIVLPGGRKWRKPKDAFNDQFIAETIIGQSEVLVGSTIGVNFCKYIPAKFDGANSAVCRLIHEIEDKEKEKKAQRGIEGRPEKVMAEEDYQPPISKRHFFAAKLAEVQESDHP